MIDVIIVTVDNKKAERLVKQIEETEAQTIVDEYAVFEDEFEDDLVNELEDEFGREMKIGNDNFETEMQETPLEAIDEEKESKVFHHLTEAEKRGKSVLYKNWIQV